MNDTSGFEDRSASQPSFTTLQRRLSVLLITASPLLIHSWAIAQPIPDNSLGIENSIVTNDVVNGLPSFLIEGGAQRSQNLFHSFAEFSIDPGQQVYFADPLGVENIFSRVTGDQASVIDGLLGIAGTADLYFLNPHGVMFGPDASLDIAGSVFVSTADSFTFADGTTYAANPATGDSILTVSIPLGLQTGVPPQGEILNAGNLQLAAGESLTLLGNQIEQRGAIAIPGGTVQLLGDRVRLTDTAELDVSGEGGGGLMQIGGDFQGQGTVPTATQTQVEAGATLRADAIAQGDGGTIIVWANDATEFAGFASARGGAFSGDGGFVEISGLEYLGYQGGVDTRAPQGQTGTLLLDPTNIEIVDGGADTFNLDDVDEFNDPDLGPGATTRIDATALNAALANVSLQATQDITFNADVTLLFPGVGLTAEAGRDITLNRSVQATGGGEIRFIAGRNLTFDGANAYAWTFGEAANLQAGDTVSLLAGAQVDTSPFFGAAGDVTVNAERLVLTDGAQLISGAFAGGGNGDIVVNADEVQLSGIGTDLFGNLTATALRSSSRDILDANKAGDITVTAERVQVLAGATIGAPSLNAGIGGTVRITGTDSIQVSGFTDSAQGPFVSGIFASGNFTGDAGTVRLQTPRLTVDGSAGIAVSALGTGQAGVIDIRAAEVDIAGGPFLEPPAGLVARTLGPGDAGRVIIADSDRVTLRNGGSIDASSLGFGDAGEIDIRAAQVNIVGDPASELPTQLLVSSISSNAGTVSISDSDRVSLSGGAAIDASSALGSGGSIEIKTTDFALTEGSSILNSNVLGDVSGPINISATNGDLRITGSSSIQGDNFSDGLGSNIVLNAARLTVAEGSFVTASSFGAGRSGNVDVSATESVNILGRSGISTALLVGTGNGGNVIVRSPAVTVDNATIEANSSGAGNAGAIFVNANDLTIRNRGEVAARGIFPTSGTGDVTINAGTVQLEDEGKIIVSAPSTNGGNIFLTARDRLILRRQSLISANAGDPSGFIVPPPGTGNGGNVTINTPFIIAFPEENSDITASASLGNGGNVSVTARALFGIEFRDRRTPLSDITATSDFGLDGTVNIATADTSGIENNLSELPDLPLSTDLLVAGSCLVADGTADGSFVVTGADGLPTNPNTGAISAFPTNTVRNVETPEPAAWQPGDPIQEPSGVYQLSDGRLVLSHECDYSAVE
jgi:filamentous hemagglutinin family protein